MKITDVKAYPVWVGHRNLCLVKVETDEGITGWGESGLSSREKAVAGAVDHFREFLIGKDAGRIGAIWQEVYRGQYFEGGRVLTAALSAIDIALWDIRGKALNIPIHALLGGKQRDRVQCFVTSIKPHDETLIEEVNQFIANGWKVIRTAAGDMAAGTVNIDKSVSNTASVLTELRSEIGPDIVLGIDFHSRLSVAEAARFCQKMPSGTLDFLEEPIRYQSVEAYEALRKMTDVPFAIGEECSDKWQFAPLIERGLTNYARIDVCNVGGITEAMKVAAMAETHYIDVMPHDPLGPICTAASLQICAAIPNCGWYEVAPYALRDGDEEGLYFEHAPHEENCALEITDRPGHGVLVNEEAVEAASFKFWEAPRMTRPDGSFTNW
ncbi:mandelate racemase/muconate lactonizing enzyme family protein [Erythrobacter sp. F6033]|uniref:mandelate racemase/muconate lactonizing enzyme family protein n=1 Tax=Erythrobacter sp. F6033 TaxID=2926401 RepID=UPI001FF0E97E|nr:mandelate racemase/muconate lactonizing enzyme family protein [Erythrobacter sp. F6033]MCK0129281.1 mandelate racemase/muconate lactonizing enzyme family protein [Erythrobacter sp. F6033]